MMGEVIKAELHRFVEVLLSYTKVVVGGMFFATIVLFLYAGLRTNKPAIEFVVAFVVAGVCCAAPLATWYVSRDKRRLQNVVELMKVQFELLRQIQELDSKGKEKNAEGGEVNVPFRIDQALQQETDVDLTSSFLQAIQKAMTPARPAHERERALREHLREQDETTRKLLELLLLETDVNSPSFQHLKSRLREYGVDLPRLSKH